ncbi:MAG TPA: hypothetical protein VMU85_17690, partial [Stellaceae bacterium]|nr:hypothetical protein [Stellaceae bacterium]
FPPRFRKFGNGALKYRVFCFLTGRYSHHFSSHGDYVGPALDLESLGAVLSRHAFSAKLACFFIEKGESHPKVRIWMAVGRLAYCCCGILGRDPDNPKE